VNGPPAASRTASPDGVRIALRFLGAVRDDPVLRDSLASVTADGELDTVAAFAAEAGFPVSAGDLRAAFKLDWGLRRARQLRS
jgi:hypothetical protein